MICDALLSLDGRQRAPASGSAHFSSRFIDTFTCESAVRPRLTTTLMTARFIAGRRFYPRPLQPAPALFTWTIAILTNWFVLIVNKTEQLVSQLNDRVIRTCNKTHCVQRTRSLSKLWFGCCTNEIVHWSLKSATNPASRKRDCVVAVWTRAKPHLSAVKWGSSLWISAPRLISFPVERLLCERRSLPGFPRRGAATHNKKTGSERYSLTLFIYFFYTRIKSGAIHSRASRGRIIRELSAECLNTRERANQTRPGNDLPGAIHFTGLLTAL